MLRFVPSFLLASDFLCFPEKYATPHTQVGAIGSTFLIRGHGPDRHTSGGQATAASTSPSSNASSRRHIFSSAMSRDNSQSIVEYLMTRPYPVGVAEVAHTVGVKNWSSALATLLELVIEDKIQGIKTSHGWYFTAKKEASTA